MAGAVNGAQGVFLPQLTAAFKSIDPTHTISTEEFANACERILPIFDHLGTVFGFARSELATKRESIKSVAPRLKTLDEVVAADVKANTVTVKNSASRNLHRLVSAIGFIQTLLANLASDPSVTLRGAASDAYNATMAPIHSYLVRKAVQASMFTLPSRDHFLQSIGETEITAKQHAEEFNPVANTIIARVEKLYPVKMPRSDTQWI
ncbi:hypothetical protein WJX72_012151 [[Myrmecia] bisecta]|uniref:Glycolipid transfer protein domain-containing protein n=1 Tax=[Myrmecia] bisecta TaxID=41462 RepID=A0AAW1QT88_9CHLO